MGKRYLSGPARAGYLMLSAISLLAGIIGIVLPLLPTTPFLILAAWSAAKGSSRFHNWLMSHRHIREPVLNWQKEGAIPSFAKCLAVAMLAVSWTGLFLLGTPWIYLLLAAAFFVSIGAFIATRPTPTR